MKIIEGFRVEVIRRVIEHCDDNDIVVIEPASYNLSVIKGIATNSGSFGEPDGDTKEKTDATDQG